jgi:DNA repair protein RecO (recombination protein O)
MDIEAPALVIGVLPHGEHGAVVRFLTHDHGLVAGYVRGGRSRRLRPVLGLGNSVALQLHARLDSQLGSATVELGSSRAGLALDALGAASLEWLTGLTATLLTEGVPHPPLYSVLDGLLEAMTLGVEPARAMAGVARYELLLMAELGFGPDLSNCVVTGATTDLAYVSPKSSHAVSRGAGLPYAARLLPLPALLLGADDTPSWDDVAAALHTTGHFLERDMLTGRLAALLAARTRLTSLIARQQDAAVR